mgnify:CR=1 FL=1
MSGDSTVSGFSLNNTISVDQNTGHQAKGAIALSDAVRLNVTVVVLAGPDEASFGFDHVSDHIIDESVLIGDTSSLEILLELGIIDSLEDILESSVVFLEDGVLGGEVNWVLSQQTVLEGSSCEGFNGL